MRTTRSVINAAMAVQIVLLGIWTAAQISTLRELVTASRVPGAENFAPSIVIAGVFSAVLCAVVLISIIAWATRVRSLNLVVRLELGVAGLAVVSAIANQALPGLPVVAVGILACAIFAVSLRTRLE